MHTLHAAHQHHPLPVVDDLILDEYGRFDRWTWHLECLTCGKPLDHDPEPADQAAAAFAVEVAS